MGTVAVDISMSLDGFITGPSPSVENGLGDGGERLHEWVYGLHSWRDRHGLEGGERGQDAEVLEEAFADLLGTARGCSGKRPRGRSWSWTACSPRPA